MFEFFSKIYRIFFESDYSLLKEFTTQTTWYHDGIAFSQTYFLYLITSKDFFLLQSQVVHILASFHWRTGSAFKSPVDCQQSQGQVFWIINLLLLLVPQVFAWRCYNDQEFFFATKHENMSGTIITLRKHDTSEVDGKSSYSHISTTIKSEKGVVTQTQVEGRVTRSRKNLAWLF